MNEPVAGRLDRGSRLTKRYHQIERNDPASLPSGERASLPFLALIQPQLRGRPLSVTSKPW
jgi:hypothetical protein